MSIRVVIREINRYVYELYKDSSGGRVKYPTIILLHHPNRTEFSKTICITEMISMILDTNKYIN